MTMIKDGIRASFKKEDLDIINGDIEELGLSQPNYILLLNIMVKTNFNLRFNDKIPIEKIDGWLWQTTMSLKTRRIFGSKLDREYDIICELAESIRKQIQKREIEANSKNKTERGFIQ